MQCLFHEMILSQFVVCSLKSYASDSEEIFKSFYILGLKIVISDQYPLECLPN